MSGNSEKIGSMTVFNVLFSILIVGMIGLGFYFNSIIDKMDADLQSAYKEGKHLRETLHGQDQEDFKRKVTLLKKEMPTYKSEEDFISSERAASISTAAFRTWADKGIRLLSAQGFQRLHVRLGNFYSDRELGAMEMGSSLIEKELVKIASEKGYSLECFAKDHTCDLSWNKGIK